MRLAILLLAHLVCASIYLYLDGTVTYSGEWHGLLVDQWFSIGYFLSEAFFAGTFIVLGSYKTTWLERQLCIVEGGFIYLRGIIYALNDSLIVTDVWQRAFYMVVYLFIVSLIVVFNAYRYGHFKN